MKCTTLLLSIASLFTLLFGGTSKVAVTVDTGTLGAPISNKVSNVNVWDMGTQFINAANNPDYDVFEFAEYVQLMQCTGGTAERDLFKDPLDTTVLDDYDFSRLVGNCRGILRLGAKPMLKLGSVPLKLTKDAVMSGFGMNAYPPDDYNAYYNYIKAMTEALVDAFGLSEVQSWRFGVMTEFENGEWFYAKSGKPEDAMEAYCKLYDYTVQALLDVLGDDVFVGAHAMSVTEGIWDENDFIRHVAIGTNYANGGVGAHISYLSASFYDSRPGKFTRGKTLENTVGDLRKTAERYGLNGLLYGVDEGRLLSASSGADDSQLLSRTVGYTWQAAYDARMWTKTVRSDIDYFSSWGYLTDGILNGYPTISYHVATLMHKMAGDRVASLQSTTGFLRTLFGIEVDGTASFDSETNTARVMLYNFKNRVAYRKSAEVQLSICVPQLAGKEVTVTQYTVGDDCNFFDEWLEDRKTYGITDDCFAWSPDDPLLDSPTTLHDPEARALYYEKLRDKYIECAKLVPTQTTVTVGADGLLTMNPVLEASNVLFLELTEGVTK